jgi:hypothetical protein
MIKIALALALILIIFIAGCTSSTNYEQPTTGKAIQPTTPQTTEQPKPVEQPAVKTFKVGETATNGKLAITLNNVRYATLVDEKNNEYMIAQSPEGKKFVIIDVILENLEKDKTHPVSSIMMFKLSDKEGYGYNLDFVAFTALDKACKCDGDLLPGMKMRGELPFEVPENAQGLQLFFLYGIGETTAVFDLQ